MGQDVQNEPGRSELDQVREFVRHRKFDEAVAVLNDLLERNPDDAAACETLATTQFLRADFTAAADGFERLTRLRPRHAEPFVNLGAVYNRMRQYQKAVDAIRRGLQRNRRCSEAYYNLGIAQRGLGRTAMAVSAYREALKLAPEMIEAHNNLANALVEMGNYQQAILHFEQALELKPDFSRARRGLDRARQSMDESRKNTNPFGRLVAAPAGERAPRPDSAPAEPPPPPPARTELSVEERVEMHGVVSEHSREVGKALEELSAALRETVLPSLSTLNRELAKGTENARHLPDARESFQQGLERVGALRRAVSQSMRVLRDRTAEL